MTRRACLAITCLQILLLRHTDHQLTATVQGSGQPHKGELRISWLDLVCGRGDYAEPSPASDDVCVLLYTSGTTSAPKGVQHSHNSILAEQATLPDLIAGEPDDVQLVTFPPGHVAGVSSMLRPLMSGSRSVFLDMWDPVKAVDLIHRFGVTATAGTPFHLDGLLRVSGARYRTATLREFLIGAATVTEEQGRRAQAAGIITYRCYGLTEQPTVTGTRPGDRPSVRLGTDGPPMRGSAVRILGRDAVDVPVGVDGEVVVQGPDQFIGYRNSALNAEAFTPDGWLRTGDLGHLDEAGRLTITDRIKDVIIRGGETISAGQVEGVLIAHPSVAEGVAVAAPHPRYGEVVAAVVVLEPGRTMTLDELRLHFANTGLAKQKTPERLVVVDELPRTALGKVRKADRQETYFG
jgi:acyl-CoA synthetase (AMP-forming)/AMP-acid ligase II